MWKKIKEFIKNQFTAPPLGEDCFDLPDETPPKIRKAGFEINEAVRRNAHNSPHKKHVRAGDYCNTCKTHISECTKF